MRAHMRTPMMMSKQECRGKTERVINGSKLSIMFFSDINLELNTTYLLMYIIGLPYKGVSQ